MCHYNRQRKARCVITVGVSGFFGCSVASKKERVTHGQIYRDCHTRIQLGISPDYSILMPGQPASTLTS